MKLLLLDADHCLGRALIDESASRSDVELIVERSRQCSSSQLGSWAPDAVIFPPLLCPASVDYAEMVEHVDQVEAIMTACHAQAVPLVWFVSDQIFDAGSDMPIEESVLPSPRDEGLQRLLETGNRLRSRLAEHFIVRIGPLMALEGRNAWLAQMLEAMVDGRPLRAAEDEIVCPTPVQAVARAVIGMLAQQFSGANAWGAYHLAGVEPVSLYTFHGVVRHQLEMQLERRHINLIPGEIQPLHHHHDQPLRRVLNCRQMLETFGVHQKPWRLALDAMLEQWCQMRFDEEKRP
ncbi:sugar nucleotide-binding protein [Kushneria indalinina]|uniref:dTDP-4-dehydrorhamnose reductase n=1 Tax=Kushneria indalinina DSM 14324 TaxID=1122140 RepID=A0A3D9DT17_9GAMM|nr:sugar nucleotide-binding protein [Kushneria indalinina]REC93920.1 dTDP-4-dehydrorhamnose reductase [Kushneria indalinina DSM 14324]